jgi:hypothetical protein
MGGNLWRQTRKWGKHFSNKLEIGVRSVENTLKNVGKPVETDSNVLETLLRHRRKCVENPVETDTKMSGKSCGDRRKCVGNPVETEANVWEPLWRQTEYCKVAKSVVSTQQRGGNTERPNSNLLETRYPT